MGFAGQMPIEERKGNGTVLRRYVPGPGVDEVVVWYEGSGTTDRRWLHADERGSVIAVSDGSGAMLAINRYDEYGIPQSGNAGRFQYTGQMWIGELGLYSYKARMYSPTLGRFMQADPIGYGDGMNRFNYVGGDPVNFTDPSGLDCDSPSKDNPCITIVVIAGWRGIASIVLRSVPFTRASDIRGPSDGGGYACPQPYSGSVCVAPKPLPPRPLPCVGSLLCKKLPPYRPCGAPGINEREYAIPNGFQSAGMPGNRFVRDGNGTIVMNPNYEAARANATGADWKGFGEDIAVLSFCVAFPLRSGEMTPLGVTSMVGSAGAKTAWQVLPHGQCMK